MPTQFTCFDDPEGIQKKDFCVNALSKNLDGEMPLSGGAKKNAKSQSAEHCARVIN